MLSEKLSSLTLCCQGHSGLRTFNFNLVVASLFQGWDAWTAGGRCDADVLILCDFGRVQQCSSRFAVLPVLALTWREA